MIIRALDIVLFVSIAQELSVRERNYILARGDSLWVPRMERADIFEAVVVMSLILLSFFLFLSILAGPAAGGGNWDTSSVNATPYMYAGNDGWLYMFDVLQDGTEIYAVDPEGRLAWSYHVPGERTVVYNWQRNMVVFRNSFDQDQVHFEFDTRPIFAADNGTMYLYIANAYSPPGSIPTLEKVIAIFHGHVLWERPLIGNRPFSPDMDAWLQVYGDRLYVYHSYSLEVLGTNGTSLYAIPYVSDPPAIDSDGNLYVSNAMKSPYPKLDDIMVPSGIIESYGPDGALRWTAEVNGTPVRQNVDRTIVQDGGSLPLYRDGQLCLPLKHGMVVLDTDGYVAWAVNVDDNVSLVETMPFGLDGTVYMARDIGWWVSSANQTPAIYAISPGGNFTVTSPPTMDMDLLAASHGIGYYGKSRSEDDYRLSIDSLLSVNITAVDLRSGNILWTQGILPMETTSVVADEKNVWRLFEYYETVSYSIAYTQDHPDLAGKPGLTFAILGNSVVNIFSAGNVIYVSYYLYNYEHPVGYWTGTTYNRLFIYGASESSAYNCPALIGSSRICYASGVAALDRNGSILWNQPLDSMLAGMVAGGSTVFFGTRGGGLSAVRANAAMGFTLTAALYLFIRFFMVGAVARARSRINDNVNRNRVLELVKKQPGNTMYDIARLLGMNAGTVRYHLLILGMNHRIVTFREGKYVRYFGNSGAYSEQEREIISLLRREWAHGLLATLAEQAECPTSSWPGPSM